MDQVTFTTEDGIRLEGELRMPDSASRGVAVICHPHPRHGGSKDHPLLWAIRNDLAIPLGRGFRLPPSRLVGRLPSGAGADRGFLNEAVGAGTAAARLTRAGQDVADVTDDDRCGAEHAGVGDSLANGFAAVCRYGSGGKSQRLVSGSSGWS